MKTLFLTINIIILCLINTKAQTEIPEYFKPHLRYNLPLVDANHWKMLLTQMLILINLILTENQTSQTGHQVS